MNADEPLTATTLAERALVGALIWDPRRVGDVQGWLRSSDFSSATDRMIYESVVGMVADGRSEGLVQALPGVLARNEYEPAFHELPAQQENPQRAQRRPHGDWLDRVDDRLRTTPAPPPSGPMHLPDKYAERFPFLPATTEYQGPPSEHVRYGRMVLEAATRRDVLAMGSQIEEAADLSLSHLDEAIPVLSAMLDEATTRLDELADRVASAADSEIAEALVPGQRSKVTGAPIVAPGAGPVAGRRLTKKALERAEMETLAGALTNPELRATLMGRLEGQDFSLKTVGASWEALTALHRRGEPVDYVTLAWETERRAPQAGRGVAPEQLLRIGTRDPIHPEAYRACEIVARAALVAHTKAAQHDVQQAARQPAATAHDLVDTARTAYRGASAHARRLGGSTPGLPGFDAAGAHHQPDRPGAARGR